MVDRLASLPATFEKTGQTSGAVCTEEINISESSVFSKGGTAEDRYDMHRVGKKQELRRNFQFVSTLGFTAVLISTWEANLVSSSYGLINGGLAGIVWMYVVAWLGCGSTILSMAEMASMAPTSAGQYHWVSEFAPPSAQKFLSFTTGWICVLAWQTNIASGGYLVAVQIQGLLIINDPSYVFQRWHGTLMIIAVAIIAMLFNTFFARKMPLIQGLMLVIHLCGFFAILIPLWVLAPKKTSARGVFTEFQNNGGWSNLGLSCLIGITGPVYSLVGFDAAVHMGEEIKDASRALPLALMWTVILNGFAGFVMVLTYCFCIGNIHDALASPSGQPYIEVFLSATGSHAGATAMAVVIIITTICSTIDAVASASRQLFAFARDRGLPFASFLSQVKPGWDVPLNAILAAFIVNCLLSLINVGSSVAFNAIISLTVAALLTSYMMSISCILLKRWRDEALPNRRWSLGRWGAPLNIVALTFLSLAYFFTFWPLYTPVTAETLNWTVGTAWLDLHITKSKQLKQRRFPELPHTPIDNATPNTAFSEDTFSTVSSLLVCQPLRTFPSMNLELWVPRSLSPTLILLHIILLQNINTIADETTVNFYTDASCNNIYATVKTDTNAHDGQCGYFDLAINSARSDFITDGCYVTAYAPPSNDGCNNDATPIPTTICTSMSVGAFSIDCPGINGTYDPEYSTFLHATSISSWASPLSLQKYLSSSVAYTPTSSSLSSPSSYGHEYQNTMAAAALPPPDTAPSIALLSSSTTSVTSTSTTSTTTSLHTTSTSSSPSSSPQTNISPPLSNSLTTSPATSTSMPPSSTPSSPTTPTPNPKTTNTATSSSSGNNSNNNAGLSNPSIFALEFVLPSVAIVVAIAFGVLGARWKDALGDKMGDWE